MTEKSNEPLQQVYATMAYELIAASILDSTTIEMDLDLDSTFEVPPVERVIVSYGWIGGKDIKGVCIHGPDTVKDKDAVIFIRPDDWYEPKAMLTVLVHEMIHAGCHLDESNTNHVDDGDFDKVAKSLGLWNGGTEPGESFLELMGELADQLPDFPAAMIEGIEPKTKIIVMAPNSPNEPPEPPKQKNRSMRWICDCGVIVRVSRKDFQATCDLCSTAFAHRAAPSEG